MYNLQFTRLLRDWRGNFLKLTYKRFFLHIYFYKMPKSLVADGRCRFFECIYLFFAFSRYDVYENHPRSLGGRVFFIRHADYSRRFSRTGQKKAKDEIFLLSKDIVVYSVFCGHQSLVNDCTWVLHFYAIQSD